MRNRPLEVLMVEDDPGDVDLTKEALKDAKAIVNLNVVDDGVKALQYLHGESPYVSVLCPDLILLDLNLPKKDGREVLHEIKSEASLKHIPVVVLTTSSSVTDILKTYNFGANSYMTKPLGFDRFKKLMQTIVDYWLTASKTEGSAYGRIPNQVNVLLIEDDSGDAEYLGEILSEETEPCFNIERADSLKSGLECLANGDFDVILLDLSLPDSQGMDTFAQAHSTAPFVPIVILTGLDDKSIAFETVRKGAQDYLVKGKGGGKMLARVIRYAIERQKMQSVLQSQATVDDLTGLYNRRGFLNLAERHLKLAMRTRREFLLILADLDGLKHINDTFGHHEGDLALIMTGQILRETFRESDIIARIGGDEFAIIAIEPSKNSGDVLTSRLRENLDLFNAQKGQRYTLSISAGAARFDPEMLLSLEELMARADEKLYQQKQISRNSGAQNP